MLDMNPTKEKEPVVYGLCYQDSQGAWHLPQDNMWIPIFTSLEKAEEAAKETSRIEGAIFAPVKINFFWVNK